jgi:hypothetical protein
MESRAFRVLVKKNYAQTDVRSNREIQDVVLSEPVRTFSSMPACRCSYSKNCPISDFG